MRPLCSEIPNETSKQTRHCKEQSLNGLNGALDEERMILGRIKENPETRTGSCDRRRLLLGRELLRSWRRIPRTRNAVLHAYCQILVLKRQ